MSFEDPTKNTNEKFIPKYSGRVYEGTEGSIDIQDDPRFIEILEEKCLTFLKAREVEFKNQGGTHFYNEYSGELAPSGYLLSKDGKETNDLPSQNIAGDIIKLEQEAARDFMAKYPDGADELELRGKKIVH